jgi:hypothetical protein
LVLGHSFRIINNSTGVVTVQSSGSNTIQAMAANTTLIVTCILTSGTGAASWDAKYSTASIFSGGGTNSAAGTNATAAGNNSLALGASATASGANSLSIGANSSATQDSSIAVGSAAHATGAGGSVALGQAATASGQTSIAIGFSASTSNESSIVMGTSATCGGTSAIAIGESTNANATKAIAIGFGSVANGTSSVAMGSSSTANNAGSFVFCDSSGSKKTDTTTNQFVATFANGFLFYKNSSTPHFQCDSNGNLINNKGTADQSYSYQTPATGFSITIGAGVKTLSLDPAGTLATGTVTMPASPIDGQEIRVTSSQTVTALTVSANSGQSITNAPTTLTAGLGFSYIYKISNTTWYRLY